MARKALRFLTRGMLMLAGVALTSIMFLTVTDVVMRFFKAPISGTYELVGFLAAWAVGFALPQTSIDKGHVVMDFLTGKLPGWANRTLYVVSRLVGMGFFAFAAYNLFSMGRDLMASGEETPLRHLPLYPLPIGIAFACMVESVVLAFDIFEDGEVQP